MNALFQQAAAAAKEAGTDNSEASKGFERKVTPAGLTPARFIGYVETGSHVEQFEGKDKAPARQVIISFELNGPDHGNSFEKDGETKTWNNTIHIDMAISQNEKSGFYKLFKKMAYGRDAVKSFPQMLGEAFIVKVVHKKSKTSGKDYPVIKEEGEWTIMAPFQTDPLNGTVTTFDIKEMTEAGRVMLWDSPNQEMWDSIFIDGTYTKTVNDVEQEISKNFIQNKCLEATDFAGSKLEALVGGLADLPLTLDNVQEEVEAILDEVAAPAEAPAADDPLKGLNL